MKSNVNVNCSNLVISEGGVQHTYYYVCRAVNNVNTVHDTNNTVESKIISTVISNNIVTY